MEKIRNPKSDVELLEARARVLAKPISEEGDEEGILRLITLLLGEERYGVEIDLVREIQPLKEGTWSRVPSTPDFIVGAVNIRGRIHSIMDVARFLGLPARPVTENAHVLLVQGGGGETGDEMELCILADVLPESADIPVAHLQTQQGTVSDQTHDYVHGVTEDLLVILDLGRLLSDPGIVVNEEL